MLDRRTFVGGMTALATTPFLPASGRAAYPLLSPLPPLKPDLVPRLIAGFMKHGSTAMRADLPEFQRVLYQHMAGLRWCILHFPRADAVGKLEELTTLWPRLKTNVDLVIAARMEEREWDWDYSRVRIDGGPPPREELPF